MPMTAEFTIHSTCPTCGTDHVSQKQIEFPAQGHQVSGREFLVSCGGCDRTYYVRASVLIVVMTGRIEMVDDDEA